jgi:hypothetical protein
MLLTVVASPDEAVASGTGSESVGSRKISLSSGMSVYVASPPTLTAASAPTG